MALIAVLAGGCSSKPSSSPASAARDNTSTAADGGQIKVIESGFTMTDPVPDSDETVRALAAVIVQNTSKVQEAQATDLTVQVFDASGRSLFQQGGSPATTRTSAVPIVQPGATLGLGFLLTTDEAADLHRTGVRLKVTVGTSNWRTAEPDTKISLGNTKIEQNADGSATLSYTETVPNQTGLADRQAPMVSLLFRNSAGKLMGGIPFGRAVVGSWNTGTTQGKIQFTAQQWKYIPPPGADLTRTEAYGSFDGG